MFHVKQLHIVNKGVPQENGQKPCGCLFQLCKELPLPYYIERSHMMAEPNTQTIEELTEKINELTTQVTQANANVEALTNKYNEVKGELEQKKEELVTVKAANMALSLTNGREEKTTDDILADIFGLKGAKK